MGNVSGLNSGRITTFDTVHARLLPPPSPLPSSMLSNMGGTCSANTITHSAKYAVA